MTLKTKEITTAFHTELFVCLLLCSCCFCCCFFLKGMILLPGCLPCKLLLPLFFLLLLRIKMNSQVLCQNVGLLENHIRGLLYVSNRSWDCAVWILKQRLRMLLTHKNKIKQTLKAVLTLKLTLNDSGKGRMLVTCPSAFLSLHVSQEK